MTYKCSVWVPAIPLSTHLQLLSPLTAFPPTAEASLLSFGPPGMFPLHSAYFSFQWTSTLFHPFSSLYKCHWLRGFPWPFLIKSNSRVHHQTYTPIPPLFSFILQGTYIPTYMTICIQCFLASLPSRMQTPWGRSAIHLVSRTRPGIQHSISKCWIIVQVNDEWMHGLIQLCPRGKRTLVFENPA